MKITRKPSPHGFKPQGRKPDLIVVHSMGEYIDLHDDPVPDPHAHEFLQQVGLSAHILVAPDCEVFRLRSDNLGAYHAKGFNQTDEGYSLGIEVLVPGSHTYATFAAAIKEDWVDPDQFHTTALIVKEWADMFEIPSDRVVRHSDISPGRKIDPGDGFEWDRLKEAVYG